MGFDSLSRYARPAFVAQRKSTRLRNEGPEVRILPGARQYDRVITGACKAPACGLCRFDSGYWYAFVAQRKSTGLRSREPQVRILPGARPCSSTERAAGFYPVG